jgi:hypothetical protein
MRGRKPICLAGVIGGGGGGGAAAEERDRRTRVIGQAVLLAGGRSLFAASEVIMGPRSGSL